MKTPISLFVAAGLLWSTVAVGAAVANDVAGNWTGTLDDGTVKLRLVFKIRNVVGGGWTARMDSLDQGANGIPPSAITLKAGKVRLEAKGIGGVYEGTLAADGATFNGQWGQGGQTLPLEFKKADQ